MVLVDPLGQEEDNHLPQLDFPEVGSQDPLEVGSQDPLEVGSQDLLEFGNQVLEPKLGVEDLLEDIPAVGSHLLSRNLDLLPFLQECIKFMKKFECPGILQTGYPWVVMLEKPKKLFERW
jgi:hypothetical protein